MTYISNTFPTAIQTGTDPIGTDGMSTFDHAGLESFQNDSILALKNKVGVDSSAVNTSHDYKLSGVSTGDKAVSKTGTDTLTNKRISKRVITTTQSATPTINTDNTDIASITGLAQAITSMTTNLSGTPVAGDMLMIQITDDGTARAITWGASFASTTVSLPTTTVISTMLRVLFQRNTANTIWDCIGTA